MTRISKVIDDIIAKNTIRTNKKYGIDYDWYDKSRFATHFLKVEMNLLSTLTVKHSKQFTDADGQELVDKGSKPAKMKSIFSSSALAVNSFSYIDESGKSLLIYNDQFCSVDFERPLRTLTKKNGTEINANLDVFLKGKHSLLFIESKFTETYGSKHNNKLSDSYITKNSKYNYDEFDISLWEPLISKIHKTYPNTRFDIQQNVKHLIGIYNYLKDNPSHINDNIILLNLVYDVSGLTQKPSKKQEESLDDFKQVKKLFEQFANKNLSISKFTYNYMHYSDFIHQYISDYTVRTYLLERYFGISSSHIINTTYYDLLSNQLANDISRNRWDYSRIVNEFDDMNRTEMKNQWYDYKEWLNDTMLVFVKHLDYEISKGKVSLIDLSGYIRICGSKLSEFYI